MGRRVLHPDDRRGHTLGVSITKSELEFYHSSARARGLKLADMARKALSEYIRQNPAADLPTEAPARSLSGVGDALETYEGDE